MSFSALGWKSVAQHVGVGMGAASFWRGAWYVLDDHLFPDNATLSAVSSLSLGVLGMTLSQGLIARTEQLAKSATTKQLPLKAARFGALYTIAMSCVLVWRGTWIGWDVAYEKFHTKQQHQQYNEDGSHLHYHTTTSSSSIIKNNSIINDQEVPKEIKSTDPGHATLSGVLSHVVAVSLLVGTGVFASVLAPPAATSVIRDWAVRATGRTTAIPSGPAQKVYEFWRNSSSAVSSKTKQQQSVDLIRSYNTSSYPMPFSKFSSSSGIRRHR